MLERINKINIHKTFYGISFYLILFRFVSVVYDNDDVVMVMMVVAVAYKLMQKLT